MSRALAYTCCLLLEEPDGPWLLSARVPPPRHGVHAARSSCAQCTLRRSWAVAGAGETHICLTFSGTPARRHLLYTSNTCPCRDTWKRSVAPGADPEPEATGQRWPELQEPKGRGQGLDPRGRPRWTGFWSEDMPAAEAAEGAGRQHRARGGSTGRGECRRPVAVSLIEGCGPETREAAQQLHCSHHSPLR